MDAYLELLKLALVGLVSGLFSYYLSSRQHRSEKWWEIRVAAYQEVIAALSDLSQYFSSHLDAELRQKGISADEEKELNLLWDSGFQKVRKAADAGAFLFSSRAETALKTFIKGQDTTYDSYFEYLDGRCADAKTCLDTLIASSKTDLRLRASFLQRFINKL